MNTEQLKYYQQKLLYEMDSSDVYEAFNNNANIVVVDGRKKSAYEKEHIPTAVNLPHRDICINTTSQLDKSKVYVCYCD